MTILRAGFFFGIASDILSTMAYEVTATRRRPKTFDELEGQEFVVATIKSSIQSGRIAHAYLFSGPRGCGKTSAARILARSLNCEKGPTANPCGECANCQEIARGASMDVIEIDGASNTGVNDVRQIKDEVLFPPNSGRYKVYIIDEVHMLSNSAFNALLKTIEEPPPYIIFIFATTELHKVPATIKSRCQQFSFRLIPLDIIKKTLAKACEEMGVQAEDEALFWIAKESTGSLRDAYTLLDQVVAFSDGHLRAEVIRQKLGLIGLDTINALAESCVRGAVNEALAQVDGILERGISIEQFIIDLAGYYRSLLLLKNGIEREALLGYAPDRFSREVLETLTGPQIERAVSLLLEVYRQIRYSVSPRFELETTVVQLCRLTDWIAPEDIKAAIDQLRGRLLIDTNGARWGPQGAADSPVPSKQTSAKNIRGVLSSQALGEESANPSVQEPPIDMEKPGALTEGFKRFMAAKGSGSAQVSGASEAVSTPTEIVMATETVVSPEPQNTLADRDDRASLDDQDDQEDTLEEPSLEEPLAKGPAPFLNTEVLRKEVINFFKKERGILASGLEKSLPWDRRDFILIIPVQDRLTAEILRKDQATLTSALRKIAGTEINITIEERAPHRGEPSGESQTIPDQVETVRRMFRGTIVRIS